MTQPWNLAAGSRVEVDIQVSSGLFNLFVVDENDWNSRDYVVSYLFDHPYVNATGVTGNVTLFAQIPLTGKYWIVIDTHGVSTTQNSASYQIWDQTPSGQTTLLPLGDLPPSGILIGIASLTFAGVAVLAVRRRSEARRYVSGESGVALDATVGTSGSEERAMRDLGTPSSDQCIVCNMEMRRGEPLVTCPSCGSRAHRAHMLEWLHVHDYCPACGKHLDERSLERPSQLL